MKVRSVVCDKGGHVYEVIQGVATKKYHKGACSEAVCDIDAMMMALERLRSSHDADDVVTALLDDNSAGTDSLPTGVRQLVTDSKNLVAGALSSMSGREARLRVLVETTMHTLAGVFLHCCRLVARSSVDRPPSPGVATNVADHLMEAARSLRTTVEAGRAVLEAGSDTSALDSSKNALLATAALLAKSLSVLVHEVKTV